MPRATLAYKGHCLVSHKDSLRIHYLAARERMSLEARQRGSVLCRGPLVAQMPPEAVVAGYCAHRGEVDVGIAMASLAEKGHTLCLPVIEASGKPLYFRAWKPGDILEAGRYGIAIPSAHAPVLQPQVLVVPVVAFDRAGHRLGYGAGYYDRTIAGLREKGTFLVIGVAYSEQEVESIPPGRYDQRLDIIITEKETLKVAQ